MRFMSKWAVWPTFRKFDIPNFKDSERPAWFKMGSPDFLIHMLEWTYMWFGSGWFGRLIFSMFLIWTLECSSILNFWPRFPKSNIPNLKDLHSPAWFEFNFQISLFIGWVCLHMSIPHLDFGVLLNFGSFNRHSKSLTYRIWKIWKVPLRSNWISGLYH